MEIILCKENNLKDLTDFYNKMIIYLDKTINYPLWVSGHYPSELTIKAAINKQHQYSYI